MDRDGHIGQQVRDVLARRVPGLGDVHGLGDDVALGADGIGLDSVAIVELFLACETAFDVRLPPDVLANLPATIGGLATAVSRARGAVTRDA